jgi:hypothetical protein
MLSGYTGPIRSVIEPYSTIYTTPGEQDNPCVNNVNMMNLFHMETLHAPGAPVLKTPKLIKKRVTFQINESGSQQTQLDLALPKTFDRKDPDPENLPWIPA